MRKKAEAEVAFARVVRRELDAINAEERAKENGCVFSPLQLLVATQVALDALVEMHDAEDAQSVVDAWREKATNDD
jgi:hypothetical protein